LVAEARGDEAGMQAIGGDPRAMQAAGEFAREKNVAELRALKPFADCRSSKSSLAPLVGG
jgi:hypothetical protein